jgi:hypothetical protein
MRPHDVTAVIVTRGDVDLDPILSDMPDFREVLVALDPPESCMGRWLKAQDATTDLVFFQDDDVLFSNHDALLDAWRDDDVMLCNMNPEWVGSGPWSYNDVGLVGAGALVRRDSWESAFIRYLTQYPEDRLLYDWADFVVGILTPHRKIDLGYTIRDAAYADNRLANTPGNRIRKHAVMSRARRMR